jgi:hypothetical protein
MVLEEAAAGFLYSLKKHKRSLRSKAGQLVTRFLGGLRGASGARSRARRRASVPGLWHRAGTRPRQHFVEQAPTGGCARSWRASKTRTDAARPVHIRSVGFPELLYHLLFARHPQHVHGHEQYYASPTGNPILQEQGSSYAPKPY